MELNKYHTIYRKVFLAIKQLLGEGQRSWPEFELKEEKF